MVCLFSDALSPCRMRKALAAVKGAEAQALQSVLAGIPIRKP